MGSKDIIKAELKSTFSVKVKKKDKVYRITVPAKISIIKEHYDLLKRDVCLCKYLPQNFIVINSHLISYDYIEGRTLALNFSIKDNLKYLQLLFDCYKSNWLNSDLRRPNVICNEKGIYIIDLEAPCVQSKMQFLLKCLNWVRDIFSKV